MIDKNQAVIDYIITCPEIQNSALYFNFINAKDGNAQIVTSTNDRYASRRYIDGSILRKYTFNIIIFKSVIEDSVVPVVGYDSENVIDMADVQAVIDWIHEQNELKNYPDFGEDCIVDEIITNSDNPVFMGVNHEIMPNLAMYSVTIEISYLDVSKKLWR